ncbi:hypothetical protein FSARC_1532 [Fusarium sarcochroum]|uniref:Uncharacterized protein n=1 Tax=Fusarium sarcochroum TaxID=1208366 RepID=A0A8H4XE24_9HYPO|nr:hypothetical protein FSARC_1532 [Fusarium sarcochroum]
MPSNSNPSYTVTTGDTTRVNTDAPMLTYFIHDTSSLQDRLIMRAAAESSQAVKNEASHSDSKDAKL